jgi:hypothetical protein
MSKAVSSLLLKRHICCISNEEDEDLKAISLDNVRELNKKTCFLTVLLFSKKADKKAIKIQSGQHRMAILEKMYRKPEDL